MPSPVSADDINFFEQAEIENSLAGLQFIKKSNEAAEIVSSSNPLEFLLKKTK